MRKLAMHGANVCLWLSPFLWCVSLLVNSPIWLAGGTWGGRVFNHALPPLSTGRANQRKGWRWQALRSTVGRHASVSWLSFSRPFLTLHAGRQGWMVCVRVAKMVSTAKDMQE